MKPNINDVLSVITNLLGKQKATKQGVSVEHLITTMNSHAGFIVPSLLQLARQKLISMRSLDTGLIVVLRDDEIVA